MEDDTWSLALPHNPSDTQAILDKYADWIGEAGAWIRYTDISKEGEWVDWVY